MRTTGILTEISEDWSALRSQIDLLLNNRGVVSNTLVHVGSVNTITQDLLGKSDQLVDKLIASEASLELINHGSEQRFLSQRIKASANEFAMGSKGWESALEMFDADVKLFGESNEIIRSMGGFSVSEDVDVIDDSYRQLVFSAESLVSGVDDFSEVQLAKDAIVDSSDTLLANTSRLIDSVGGTLGLNTGAEESVVTRILLWF